MNSLVRAFGIEAKTNDGKILIQRTEDEMIQIELYPIFDYIFSSSDHEVEKNIGLFLFLNEHLDNTNLIRAFLSDTAIKDLIPSYLKSILIMIEGLDNIDAEKADVQAIYDSKMNP